MNRRLLKAIAPLCTASVWLSLISSGLVNLEKWPAAIFRTLASLPPPKSVGRGSICCLRLPTPLPFVGSHLAVFVGCTRGGSAGIKSDGLLAASDGVFSEPEPVQIIGYSGDAMEPFISRDGKYLFFNNRNDPRVDTNLHWADNVDGKIFRYRGEIQGVNTGSLEGVPSMDRDGMFYFISPRSYEHTLSTIYSGHFGNGRVEGVELVLGLSRKQRGIVNFDAEISGDGRTLYGVDGDLSGGGGPRWARIFIARREGGGFRRLPDSDRLLANVNADRIQYAPDISADELELFYTRLTGFLLWRRAQIMRATRVSTSEPFGRPLPVESITGFAEGPSISGDGKYLYFHKQVGDGFRIYRLTRQVAPSSSASAPAK